MPPSTSTLDDRHAKRRLKPYQADLSDPQAAPALLRLEKARAAYREHGNGIPKDWMDYGEEDPLLVGADWVGACNQCKTRPTLHPFERENRKGLLTWYTVRCGCGREAEMARYEYQAWMNWNLSPYAETQPWRTLPFFFVSDMDEPAALDKLKIMLRHLELRVQLLKWQRHTGDLVGKKFERRIKACLQWAAYMIKMFHHDTGDRYRSGHTKRNQGQVDADEQQAPAAAESLESNAESAAVPARTMTVREISERLGVSEMSVRRYAEEAGSWALADLREVKKRRAKVIAPDLKRRRRAQALRDKGLTWDEVGDQLGVSGSCAHHLASKA